MSVINALLITSAQDEFPVIQYFPLNYDDKKSIIELLTIAKYFKNCGKGFLQHKNKLFYYKTYIPNSPGLNDITPFTTLIYIIEEGNTNLIVINPVILA